MPRQKKALSLGNEQNAEITRASIIHFATVPYTTSPHAFTPGKFAIFDFKFKFSNVSF